MWILEGTGGGERSWTFRLPPGAIKTLGRTPGADFIIDAAFVSRVHCRLEASEDALHVVDLASTNGTWVNGQRVERATLTAGDRLALGRIVLDVRFAGAD